MRRDVPLDLESTGSSSLFAISHRFAPREGIPSGSLFCSTQSLCFLLARSHETAKSQMTCRRIDGLGHARRRSIAPAVVWRAQMRTAFHHFARDLDIRHVGIETLVSFSTYGVEARATRLNDRVVLLVPIRGPLPHVAGHVVEPVAIGRKTSHWRCFLE